MSIGVQSDRPAIMNATLFILKRTVKLCLATHGHFLKIYTEDFTHLYVIRGEGWFWNHWQENDSDPVGGIHTTLPSDSPCTTVSTTGCDITMFAMVWRHFGLFTKRIWLTHLSRCRSITTIRMRAIATDKYSSGVHHDTETLTWWESGREDFLNFHFFSASSWAAAALLPVLMVLLLDPHSTGSLHSLQNMDSPHLLPSLPRTCSSYSEVLEGRLMQKFLELAKEFCRWDMQVMTHWSKGCGDSLKGVSCLAYIPLSVIDSVANLIFFTWGIRLVPVIPQVWVWTHLHRYVERWLQLDCGK